MEGTLPFSRSPSWRVLAAGVAWILTYVAVRFALEARLVDHPWDLVVACLPIPVFTAFAWAVVAALRDADELQRRIHLEALALAFPATMLLLMTLGLLDTLPSAPFVTPLNKVWALLPPLYGVCVGIAHHRYR